MSESGKPPLEFGAGEIYVETSAGFRFSPVRRRRGGANSRGLTAGRSVARIGQAGLWNV